MSELCREMGEAARAKIVAMFSPEVNYKRLLDTYHAASNGMSAVNRA
jgi:glycosyltransferase involved in cell wall biosynthesis